MRIPWRAMMFMATAREWIKNHPDEVTEQINYKTNFGRTRPIRQVTNVRNVKADGDVTVAQKQSGR